MRRCIRTRMIAVLPELGGRVYEPYLAGPSTVKPYAVIRFDPEVSGNLRNTFMQPIQIWLYIDKETFVTMDALANKLIAGFSKYEMTTADSNAFGLRYIGGIGEDFFDQELNALGRGFRFNIPRVREV